MDTTAFWDFMYKWELVFLLVISLSLQLVLVPMGSKRKYSSNNCLRLVLLFAYSSADWIAIVSLGIVIEKYGGGCYDEFSDPIYIIRAFWMPFLLLHLGGSDTITAYSIQDNDLWLRALFRFITNLLLSFYIFMLAMKRPKALNYIAIPVFVAGIIKYAQKIWALRSASGQHLRDLLVSPPPPFRPNTQNFVFPIKITSTGMDQLNVSNNNDPYFSHLQMLHLAYCFFKRDKRLFVDLDLSSYHLQQSLYYFEKFDSKTAFKVVELELGFIYDFFYTKAFVIHSRWGRVLRLTSVSSLVIAMVAFSCMSDWQDYPLNYVRLTFLLFSVALGLEIYSLHHARSRRRRRYRTSP